MLQTFKNGQTSVVLRAKLLDSSSTTGAGLTGLTSASAGLIISTIADNEATATAYTVAGSTVETITTLGTFAAPTATKCRFKEVDSTNHKGVYEFQFADARFAVASAKSLLVSVSGATNLQQADFVIQLQTDDPYVAKLTAAQIATGVWQDTTAGDFTTALSVGKSVMNGVALGTGLTVNDLTTKTGFALTSGERSSIATAIWTDTTAGDFTTALSVGKSIMNGVPLGTGLTVNDITTKTGYSLSAAQTFNMTGNITGNLSGSVGSVTGAVGSVTGAVGSVTGLTASNLDATVSSRLASASYTVPPTANENADGLLDRAAGIETNRTPRQGLRLMLSALAGKASGLATTTAVYRDTNDLKDRISATVDADGNRTAVTLDAT